jgi:hypothetical protein
MDTSFMDEESQSFIISEQARFQWNIFLFLLQAWLTSYIRKKIWFSNHCNENLGVNVSGEDIIEMVFSY